MFPPIHANSRECYWSSIRPAVAAGGTRLSNTACCMGLFACTSSVFVYPLAPACGTYCRTERKTFRVIIEEAVIVYSIV